MNSITLDQSSIHFNSTGYTELNQLLKNTNFSNLFVLVDENTHEHCLPKFLSQIETTAAIEIIEIDSGEEHKTIETCFGVWNAMSELNADRKSLLINLGGGVITDLGGFVASTYRRGIAFVNVPTSLLAMVDASVGGKTGVDLGGLKNQIGVVNLGEMVLVDTSFLNTLPKNQIRSGLAEMLKHGLITQGDYWDKMANLREYTSNTLDNLIYESVIIKKEIVEKDPNENGLRKTLNYGHTLGHAIESYFLNHPEKQELLHGEAIAIGMVLSTYLSKALLSFPSDKLAEIKNVLKTLYDHVVIDKNDQNEIIELLKFDKKNTHGNVNFVLLDAIGNPKLDCIVDNAIIFDAFDYYSS